MKHRNPITVALLTLVTFGIYAIVWEVKTKNEMKQLGADIPTAWLVIIPFVNLYWLWKYSQGVEHVTKKQLSAPIAFILLFILGFIGMAIIQTDFNKLSAAPAAPTSPQQPSVGNPPVDNMATSPQPEGPAPVQPAQAPANPTPTTQPAQPVQPPPPAAAPETPPAPEQPEAAGENTNTPPPPTSPQGPVVG